MDFTHTPHADRGVARHALQERRGRGKKRMKDIQGIQRGKCNKCECVEYRPPPPPPGAEAHGKPVRLRCEYCDHTPVEHVKIIQLGECKQCGKDNCEKYESEDPNSYTDCQYCGCEAKHHAGAAQLGVKRPQPDDSAIPGLTELSPDSGIQLRTNAAGLPQQTTLHGCCKLPGCKYPRWVENGTVHDFCSRTCSKKYDQMLRTASAALSPAIGIEGLSATSGMPMSTSSGAGNLCVICKIKPANLGYPLCERCHVMAKAQKH